MKQGFIVALLVVVFLYVRYWPTTWDIDEWWDADE